MRSSALVLLFVVICVAYASSINSEHSSSIRQKRQVDLASDPHLRDLIKALVEAMKKAIANAGGVLKKLAEFDAVLNVMKKKTNAVLESI